jgi:hypothetical protein
VSVRSLHTLRAAGILSRLLVVFLLTACSSDDVEPIQLSSGQTFELYSVPGQRRTIAFEASENWTAYAGADWLTCTPRSGKAGSSEVTVATTRINRTKGVRSAQLTLRCGAYEKKITVIQRGEYAVFDKDQYVLGAEGGTVRLNITTNLDEKHSLSISYPAMGWLHWSDEKERTTRASLKEMTTELSVDANTTGHERQAMFMLVMDTGEENWLPLDTVVVVQRSTVTPYESTDFSADGQMNQLQHATRGKGIPLVLLGDGFSDREVADGTYRRTMESAMQLLFTEEPARSMRDYFDVYAVTVVSRHQGVGEGYETAFGCIPAVVGSTIECNDAEVWRYIARTTPVDTTRAVAVLIPNTHRHGGITYFYGDGHNGMADQSLCIVPVIDSLGSERFRQVLSHEVMGHAIGKLADEYGYETTPVPGMRDLAELRFLQRQGWMLNVSETADSLRVPWRSFLTDSRFAGEQVGVYEGGYTFFSGIWRPTRNSMMNANNAPFNAPSRKLIYDQIRRWGESLPATTLDEFAVYDAQHQPRQWNYFTRRWQFVVPEPSARPKIRRR